MACYIFGAGGFYGLQSQPQQDDYVIAADGGWAVCQRCGIRPTVLMGDFDSLQEIPIFPVLSVFPWKGRHGYDAGHQGRTGAR